MTGVQTCALPIFLKDLSWKCGRGRQSYSANDLKKAFILFRGKGVVKTNYKQTKTKSEYKITFLIYGFLQDKEKYKKKDCRTWVGAEDEQMAYNTHAEESIYEPVSIAVSEDEHYSRTRVDAEDGNNDRCFTRLRGDWRTQNGIGEPGSHTQDSINVAPFGGSKSDLGTDSYIAPDSEHGTYMYSNNKSIVPRQESYENIPHMTDEERDEILKEHEDWKLSLDDQIGVDDDVGF